MSKTTPIELITDAGTLVFPARLVQEQLAKGAKFLNVAEQEKYEDAMQAVASGNGRGAPRDDRSPVAVSDADSGGFGEDGED